MIKNHIVYGDFTNWQFHMHKALGSFVWNDKGKKLIDFTSAWNVTNLGWNHPEIHAAMKKQLENTDYAPGWASTDIQEKFAQEFVNSLPSELNSLCRATGGTEANEEALKIAWAATGRKKILAFTNCYHGHSFAMMNLSYDHDTVKKVYPVVSEFVQLEFPVKSSDEFLTQLEKLLKKRDIAGLLTEPGIITGWGSTFVALKGFAKEIRKLTKQYGTLLIFDEVGTGFSRCGKLYGMQLENVTPDMATFAKGISNGSMPIGAVAVKKSLAEAMISKTVLYSTFGWTPLACAASLAVLKIHLRDEMWKVAAEKGTHLKSELESALANHPNVGDIRGLGMEIGVQFVRSKKSMEPNESFANQVINKALTNGLLLCYGGDGNIQLMPPLTIEQNVLDKGIEILVDAVNSASK